MIFTKINIVFSRLQAATSIYQRWSTLTPPTSGVLSKGTPPFSQSHHIYLKAEFMNVLVEVSGHNVESSQTFLSKHPLFLFLCGAGRVQTVMPSCFISKIHAWAVGFVHPVKTDTTSADHFFLFHHLIPSFQHEK